MGRNTGRGKVAYSWISPDPTKTGPILRVVVVVVKHYKLPALPKLGNDSSQSIETSVDSD